MQKTALKIKECFFNQNIFPTFAALKYLKRGITIQYLLSDFRYMKKLFFLSLLLPLALLAQPKAGYYDAAVGKSDAALKTQLFSIISTGTANVGYNGLYTICLLYTS